MNQRDGFAGGFLAGAIVGGVVGGILGALITSGRDMETIAQEDAKLTPNPKDTKKAETKRRQLTASDSESIETARRSLEDKIAQLNQTIDEVREQLGNVHQTYTEGREEPTSLHE